MSAFEKWRATFTDEAWEDVDPQAAFVAGMQHVREMALEKKRGALEQMREAARLGRDDSPGFNQWLGVHDAAGELAESIEAAIEEEEKP